MDFDFTDDDHSDEILCVIVSLIVLTSVLIGC